MGVLATNRPREEVIKYVPSCVDGCVNRYTYMSTCLSLLASGRLNPQSLTNHPPTTSDPPNYPFQSSPNPHPQRPQHTKLNRRYFESYTVQDFAKAGTVAERTVVLQPAEEPLQWFPVSMFNLFRKCVGGCWRWCFGWVCEGGLEGWCLLSVNKTDEHTHTWTD